MDPVAVADIILQGIVSNPEALRIERRDDPDAIRLGVQVDPDDVGKVIGKQGRTINAIRTVLRAAGAKQQEPIYLDLLNE
ncbi:MAG TPA: KH domain-containing protein [Pantanalinema sp.]